MPRPKNPTPEQKAAIRKADRLRAHNRRERLRAEGNCTVCAEPRLKDDPNFCPKCRGRSRKAARARYRRMHPGSPPVDSPVFGYHRKYRDDADVAEAKTNPSPEL